MVKEKSTVSFKYSLIVFLGLVLVSGIILALSSGGFIISVKEVWLTPVIGQNDFDTKLKTGIKKLDYLLYLCKLK